MNQSFTGRGEQSFNWKGDSVQYRQAHAWVRKEMLKISNPICSKCGGTKRVEIANISGKATRNIKDYIWLCKKCHNNFDGQVKQLKQGFEAILKHRSEIEMGIKTCPVCKIQKPLSEYPKDISKESELYWCCRDCAKEKSKIRWNRWAKRTGYCDRKHKKVV